MRARMLARLVVVGLLALSAGGCSLLFVSGPPRQHAELNYFTCTQSNLWPILDAIWAGLNGLGAAQALTASLNTVENRSQVILVGTGWLLLSGYSSYTGFQRTRACGEAIQQLTLRQSRSSMGTGLPASHWPVTPAETGALLDNESPRSLLELRPTPFPAAHPLLRPATSEWLR